MLLDFRHGQAARIAALLAVVVFLAGCGSLRVESTDPARPLSNASDTGLWREAEVAIGVSLAPPRSDAAIGVSVVNESGRRIAIRLSEPETAPGTPLGALRLRGEPIAYGSGERLELQPQWSRVPIPEPALPSGGAAAGTLSWRVQFELAAESKPAQVGDAFAYDLVVETQDGDAVIPLRLAIVRHDETLERTALTVGGIVVLPVFLVVGLVRWAIGDGC